MEKVVHSVGERINKFCAVCDLACGHVIATLTKGERISMVACPRCGTRSRYSLKDGQVRVKASGKGSALYNGGTTYRVGQWMTHQAYGEGEVTALVEPRKIDVLFSDRMRRLIHSRLAA